MAGATASHVFDGYEPKFVADVEVIITNVVEGLLSRFASGQISMRDVAVDLERTIHRLADGAIPEGPDGSRRARRSRKTE